MSVLLSRTCRTEELVAFVRDTLPRFDEEADAAHGLDRCARAVLRVVWRGVEKESLRLRTLSRLHQDLLRRRPVR